MTKPDTHYDLGIIGGGINGAGIARDAAGRGLSVLLVDQGDLAGATSSSSTKLIHGGLRYLEHYEFGLVRHALQEREILLSMAPHIIWPLEFILPHDRHLRPAWMIRVGLFLYDHLGGRKKLAGSRGLDLSTHPYGAPLQDHYKRGFSYADCWVDDARLVILNAMDAAKRGAVIRPRTKCIALQPHKAAWTLTLKDQHNGEQHQVTANKLINATGPWVRSLLDETGLAKQTTPATRLVKGSHIIVRRLYDGAQCYILQQPDKRIVFAIPYEHDFTLIGTTDIEIDTKPEDSAISTAEITYLCEAANRSFQKPIAPDDVVSTYSGVRPLLDDGDENAAAVTRDYKLVRDHHNGAEILSVFGGKITTYRRLAEESLAALYGHGGTWTAGAPLPGGDFPDGDFNAFINDLEQRYPALPRSMLYRYGRAYGTMSYDILGQATTLSDLGDHYGDDLYEAEIRHMIQNEWAQTAEDILWRRSKCGLHIAPDTVRNLEKTLQKQCPPGNPPKKRYA